MADRGVPHARRGTSTDLSVNVPLWRRSYGSRPECHGRDRERQRETERDRERERERGVDAVRGTKSRVPALLAELGYLDRFLRSEPVPFLLKTQGRSCDRFLARACAHARASTEIPLNKVEPRKRKIRDDRHQTGGCKRGMQAVGQCCRVRSK